MLKIDIKNLDELSELILNLSVTTFLQGLIVTDNYIDYGEEFNFIYCYARECLYEKQKEIVLKLKALVESDSFTEIVK